MSRGLFVQHLWVLAFTSSISVLRLHPCVTVLKGMLHSHPDVLPAATRTPDLLPPLPFAGNGEIRETWFLLRCCSLYG